MQATYGAIGVARKRSRRWHRYPISVILKTMRRTPVGPSETARIVKSTIMGNLSAMITRTAGISVRRQTLPIIRYCISPAMVVFPTPMISNTMRMYGRTATFIWNRDIPSTSSPWISRAWDKKDKIM